MLKILLWRTGPEPNMGHCSLWKKLTSRKCAERMNCVSSWWFWVTISGVFYYGLGDVLPNLYANSTVILTHHFAIYIMFAEMMINYFCVKLIKSPYKVEECSPPDLEEMLPGGFEINLNHLKDGASPGSYTISASSLYQNSGLKPPSNGTTMYLVAVPAPDECYGVCTYDKNRQIVYPYFSWKPCLICQCQRPPRTHHCPLCKMCVLKRDHHCFFTGTCIGLRNQRHFVVFSFWASVATLYSIAHALAYIFITLIPRNTYWDILLPITVFRYLFGYTTGNDTVMVLMLYSVVWFCFTSLGFFTEQVRIIRHGTTSFESDNGIKIINTNRLSDNVRAVFGRYWALNFLFPLHFIFPQQDDGVHWRNIKV